MKKLVTLSLSLFITIIFTSAISLESAENETTVYVCTGKYSKKYHLVKNCRGLSNCKSDIIKTTKLEAINSNKTLCGWED